MPRSTGLPAVDIRDVPVTALNFVHYYFESGDAYYAAEKAGVKDHQVMIKSLNDHTTKIGRYLTQLKKERAEAIGITLDRKRLKIWAVINKCLETDRSGMPKKPQIAIKWMDMLCRIDGDYAPIKAQVQQEVVRFDQHIPKATVVNE